MSPNGCMIVHNIKVILSVEIVENLWAVGAIPRTPLGELTALPQTLQLVGRGLLLSLSKNPTPALGLRPFGLGPQ